SRHPQRHIRHPANGRFRRNPVVAAHPGKGPFTIPLRTLCIVVATGGVWVHEPRPRDATGGGEIPILGPAARLGVIDVQSLEIPRVEDFSTCSPWICSARRAIPSSRRPRWFGRVAACAVPRAPARTDDRIQRCPSCSLAD